MDETERIIRVLRDEVRDFALALKYQDKATRERFARLEKELDDLQKAQAEDRKGALATFVTIARYRPMEAAMGLVAVLVITGLAGALLNSVLK